MTYSLFPLISFLSFCCPPSLPSSLPPSLSVGQFFREGVEIDTARKLLLLPKKAPVPVMRKPVWAYMEQNVPSNQLCWVAMNPGYQGKHLIDGHYLDYVVNDVLSTDFKFSRKQDGKYGK